MTFYAWLFYLEKHYCITVFSRSPRIPIQLSNISNEFGSTVFHGNTGRKINYDLFGQIHVLLCKLFSYKMNYHNLLNWTNYFKWDYSTSQSYIGYKSANIEYKSLLTIKENLYITTVNKFDILLIDLGLVRETT